MGHLRTHAPQQLARASSAGDVVRHRRCLFFPRVLVEHAQHGERHLRRIRHGGDDLALNLLEAARMKLTPHLPFICIEGEHERLKIFRTRGIQTLPCVGPPRRAGPPRLWTEDARPARHSARRTSNQGKLCKGPAQIFVNGYSLSSAAPGRHAAAPSVASRSAAMIDALQAVNGLARRRSP